MENLWKRIARRVNAKTSVTLLLFVLGIGGFLLLLNTDFSLQYREAETIGEGTESFKELSDRFRILADDKGAEYAFEVLARATLAPQTDLHLLGHVVGEALYQQQGVNGIRSCTPDFRNACSHSIVIGALAEFGEGALPDIRSACQEAPGGSGAYTMCFHGLGHGVLAGYGYSLPETLAFCEQTGTQEYNDREYIECFGGAVMELVGGGGHDRELWEEAREEYIQGGSSFCLSDSVPGDLREICFQYITPELWQEAGVNLGRPEVHKFKEAFSLCENIPEQEVELRRSCYGGFGKEFVPLSGARDIRDISSFTNGTFARAITWCTEAENEQGAHWCVQEGLDSVFWGGENDPAASFRYCSVAETVGGEKLQRSCFEQLAENISFYIHDAGLKSSLCEDLPSNLEQQCLE